MSRFWRRGALCCLLLLLSPLALAAGPSAVRKQVESSMLVTGTLEITAEGTVRATTIDKVDKLPKDLVDWMQSQIAQWNFHPVLVDGKATPARSAMSVRLVARRLDEDRTTVAIRSASFEGPQPKPGETVAAVQMTPPRFPMQAVQQGVSGTAYMVLKIGPDGAVREALVEQVNLRFVASESQMTRWRTILGESALRAARKWTFEPPTSGQYADLEHWSVRVPVDYTFDTSRADRYGQWEVYIPGPRERVPWDTGDEPGLSPDALIDGNIYMAGQDRGPRLLTPLDEG